MRRKWPLVLAVLVLTCAYAQAESSEKIEYPKTATGDLLQGFAHDPQAVQKDGQAAEQV